MAKIVLEKSKKKIVKVVVASRYWQSWGLFNEAFRQSQALLQQSMTVDQPLF